MNEKKKIIILTVGIILILIALGGTVAFFMWSSEEEGITSEIDVVVSSGEGTCTKTSDNEKKILPSSTRDGGRIVTIDVSHEMAGEANLTMDLVINSINKPGTVGGLNHKSFKYELINTTTKKSYGSGNFETVTAGTTINLSNVTDKLKYGETYTFTLYLWIDGKMGNNPIDMTEQPYDFDLYCNITGIDN